MRDRRPVPGDQHESEQVWQEIRNDLLQIHRNVVQILNLRAIRLFEILGLGDCLAILRSNVLDLMQGGDYGQALDNLRDFILGYPALDKMLPEIIDRVEPGLTALSRWGEEYRVSALL